MLTGLGAEQLTPATDPAFALTIDVGPSKLTLSETDDLLFDASPIYSFQTGQFDGVNFLSTDFDYAGTGDAFATFDGAGLSDPATGVAELRILDSATATRTLAAGRVGVTPN